MRTVGTACASWLGHSLQAHSGKADDDYALRAFPNALCIVRAPRRLERTQRLHPKDITCNHSVLSCAR
jgi:hypothetical protein